jgi:hypothetical protein
MLSLVRVRARVMSAIVTQQQALEILDDWATENPLDALLNYGDCLSAFRLNACALAEPAAALAYAYDLLGLEQIARCQAAVISAGMNRFVLDSRAAERRALIARARGLGP